MIGRSKLYQVGTLKARQKFYGFAHKALFSLFGKKETNQHSKISLLFVIIFVIVCIIYLLGGVQIIPIFHSYSLVLIMIDWKAKLL